MTALQTRSPHAPSTEPPPACPLLEHSLSAVLAAAADDAAACCFSPLVVCGPAGAGKSRWLGRVFVLWHERAGTAPALWDGVSLGREILAALEGDTLDRFHGRFTARPLILIDGIEQVAHPAAQQALAHLLDAAAEAGRCVVASMRLPPHACMTLERTLATRLSGGLVISLPSPPLPRQGDSSRPTAVAPTSHTAATLRRVIAVTARHYGLAPADLTGPSRRRAVAHARSMAMYLSRKLTAESLLRIGEAFGDRDHTTVMHSLRVTEDRIRRNAAVGSDAEQLLERLLDGPRRKSFTRPPVMTAGRDGTPAR